MNKLVNKFTVVWVIAVAAFNAIAFVTTNTIGVGFTTNFWIAYVAIMVGFVGQFVCTRMVIRQNSLEKTFLNLPVISVSVIGLVILLIAGIVFIVVSTIPYWIAIVVCVLVTAVSAVMVVNSTATAEIIEEVHSTNQIAQQTVRVLTAKVKAMVDSQTDRAIKREYTRLYEALRYSDPVSNPSLLQVEEEIESLVAELKAIKEVEVSAHVTKILELLNERNQLCKEMKARK